MIFFALPKRMNRVAIKVKSLPSVLVLMNKDIVEAKFLLLHRMALLGGGQPRTILLCREGGTGTTRSGSVFITSNVVSSCEKGVRFTLMCCL